VVGRDVYVVGGFVAPRDTTAVVERFRAGRWARVRPLPVALNHAAAVGYRGNVYVAGGYAGAHGPTDAVSTLYRYDPQRDHWTRLRPMPTARAALAFGALDGKLYATGGSDGRRALAALEIYDIARDRWSRGPSLAIAREHLAGAVLAGRFYAVAGRTLRTGNLGVVERYDPGRRRWQRLPDIPKRRGGNGAVGWGHELVVAIGGEESAGTIGAVDAYDRRSRHWTRLPAMPTARHGLAVVNRAGEIWAVEGGTSPGLSFSSRVEILRHAGGD
jgi:Kelch motif